MAGPAAEKVHSQLMSAASAYSAGRYADARRTLAPLVGRYGAAPSLRELYGLTLYRLGEYDQAREELSRFATSTASTEQHPVLMDCARAAADWSEVERLWDELRQASPAGELVTEGRIVMASAMAERDRLGDALRLLRSGPVDPKRPKGHHLRLWYALADLEERAGNIPRARTLFEQVRRRDATFADVVERLAALG